MLNKCFSNLLDLNHHFVLFICLFVFKFWYFYLFVFVSFCNFFLFIFKFCIFFLYFPLVYRFYELSFNKTEEPLDLIIVRLKNLIKDLDHLLSIFTFGNFFTPFIDNLFFGVFLEMIGYFIYRVYFYLVEYI